jgi:uncharacterized membrane protein
LQDKKCAGNEEEGIPVSSRLLGFLILGITLVFIGIVILVVVSVLFNSSSSSVGVVIFIGPIPIVFGTGPNAPWLILIGIILAILVVTLFLIMTKRIRRFGD